MRLSPFVTTLAGLCCLSLPAVALAEDAKSNETASESKKREAAQPQKGPSKKPKLIVAISVDQLSADIFAEYRPYYRGGLKRLSQGAVFPSGYQSHSATETCPGHSTILTGVHPARAGIVGNQWFDLSVKRDDKKIYCAEDPTVEGSNSRSYQASAKHLLVPTLGERLKSANPASKNIAIAGKDRSALMMGGQNIDQVYWWKSNKFVSLKGRTNHAAVTKANARIAKKIASGARALPVPEHCNSRNSGLQLSKDYRVGDYAFARPPEKARMIAASPYVDEEVLRTALKLIETEELGKDEAVDVVSIGLAGTDYVGHAFGTEGLEMCIQIAKLDEYLARFFHILDKQELDYAVMLTADHGGHDLPERLREQGWPTAARVDIALHPTSLDKAIKAKLNIDRKEPVIYGTGAFGDFYVSKTLSKKQRDAVYQNAMSFFQNHAQVAAVFSAKDIGKMSMPTGPVQGWSLAERARASFHPARSGDLIMMLKEAITPIPGIRPGIVATHGSPWDYDRRVPILFWQKHMRGFEQVMPVKTVDIAPTLASLVGLKVAPSEFDGRCIDLDAGPESSCK